MAKKPAAPIKTSRGPGPRDDITELEERFCNEYLVDLNGAAAATRAGYSANSAKQTAYKLMDRPRIQVRIRELIDRQKERTKVTADRVIAEYAKLAFANMYEHLRIQPDGSVIVDLSLLTPDQAAALSEVTQETVSRTGGDDKDKDGAPAQPVLRTKIKLASKQAALDSLARHLGMFNDKLQLGADRSLLDVLQAIDGKTRGLPGQDSD